MQNKYNSNNKKHINNNNSNKKINQQFNKIIEIIINPDFHHEINNTFSLTFINFLSS